MNKRILLVDDEYDIISAYKRNLRKHFTVLTALSAREGLQILSESEEIAVVISDYRMPEMNGIEFLETVAKKYPESMRIMITGHADLQLAIDAVNKGNIFRFLTKPIPTEDIIEIINDSLEIFRLKKSEKELLNNTFKGIINIFIELMQQVHPELFNHIKRIRDLGRKIAEDINIQINWEFDISLLLSKVGFIALPVDLADKYLERKQLNTEEKKMLLTYPELGCSLLSKIPRLENIAKNIKYQRYNFDGENYPEQISGDQLPLISRLLKVLNDYDLYHLDLEDAQEAMYKLQEKSQNYDPIFLKSLNNNATRNRTQNHVISINFRNLKIGMIIVRDIKDAQGTLLLKKGTEITDLLLMRLYHAAKVREINEPILVIEPYKKY